MIQYWLFIVRSKAELEVSIIYCNVPKTKNNGDDKKTENLGSSCKSWESMESVLG